MRPLLLAAPLLAALAVTACGPRVQYLQTSERVTYTTTPVTYVAPLPAAQTGIYPGSYLDSRGYRVDSGSYPTSQALSTSDLPMTPAQLEARAQRERQSNRNPVAWSHNGYQYDRWGNLVRAPR
jgi:hypothetical protein